MNLIPHQALMRRVAAAALVLANVLAAAVVLFRGRPLQDLLVVYWLETVVIVGMSILKLLVWALFCTPLNTLGDAKDAFARFAGMVLFLVYDSVGLAIMVMVPGFFLGDLGMRYPRLTLVFVVSHGLSFALNFLGRGECRRTKVWPLILQPYARLLLLNAVLAAALCVKYALPVFFESKAFALLIVIGKVALDLVTHWREHRRVEPPPLPV